MVFKSIDKFNHDKTLSFKLDKVHEYPPKF